MHTCNRNEYIDDGQETDLHKKSKLFDIILTVIFHFFFMHKKGTIIQIQFDSTTSVVMLDKNGKVLYPSTLLKSKHKEIDVPKEAFDDFMDNFKSFENQKEGKKVLSPDWLDKQIKESKKKPHVDKLRQCPYDKNHQSSYSAISSSSSVSTSEEEDSVEEIKK